MFVVIYWKFSMDSSRPIVAALERLASVLRRMQWSAAYEEGLYPIQVQVLQLCATRQGTAMTLTALAAELNVSPASMSDTLRALEAKGLIVRTPNPEDRRSVVVVLSEKGKQLLSQISRWSEPLEQVTESLSHAQREVLYETLLELLRRLYQRGHIPMPHMCLTCRWLHYDERRMTTPYWCELLKIELLPLDLRVECPDHMPAET